jgi:CRP-like cAMP-binding protein
MRSSSAAHSGLDAEQGVALEELKLFNIFHGVAEEKLAKIRDTIEIQSFGADEAVIRDGEEGDTFYLLLDGEVEITKLLVMRLSRQKVDQTDKSLIRLSSDAHPDFGKPCFGEMALFSDKSRRSATVVTIQPSRLGVIHNEDFVALCESDTEIGYRVLKNIAGMLSGRLDKANEDVLNLTTALSFVLTAR